MAVVKNCILLALVAACGGVEAHQDRTTQADSAAATASSGSVRQGATPVAAPRDTPPRSPADSAARRDTTKRDSTRVGRDSSARDREIAARWPVKGPAPLPGSILPGHRIVAYYGNPLSKKMGVLGEYAPDSMLARLDREVAAWNRADPSTPVQPALHLIVVVAQGSPGRDGKYRLRMADTLVERVAAWAATRKALVFLDVQVAGSTLREELPRLEQWLKRPNFHLGIDPEFAMKGGAKPGTKIGTMDAADVNYASSYLADLVTANSLPPKVLVVHRFTRPMLTNAEKIRLDPRVQVVINMDGWGPPVLKRDSYHDYVFEHPVQFTGFKLFYHNDVKKKGSTMMTPADVLSLTPKPVYIQYQ